MEGDGDRDGAEHRADVCLSLLRQHRAGGVHDRDLVQTGVRDHASLLGQPLGREQVGLHHGIAALHAVLLDQANALKRLRAVAGVRAHAQEFQTVFGRQRDVLLVGVLHAHEHTDLRLREIGLDQLQIFLVRERRFLGCGLVRTDAVSVAHFDDADIAADQALDYHLG